MKETHRNSVNAFKKLSLFQIITLPAISLTLTACGGGGGSDGPKTSSSSRTQSSAITSSSALSSSGASSQQSSIVSSQSSTSSESSSAQSSVTPTLIDVTNQFSSTISDNFYLFENSSQADALHYLPKKLALTGMPGVASIQRSDKVSDLLQIFLDLSDTDWTSTNQLTFSSRYTLDVNREQLTQESETAGYTELEDLNVKPPLMMLEQRYTTSVPADRIQIQCEDLTLLVNTNEITLHDCNLVDADEIIATHTINHIANVRYENLNFDPETISGNSSLRGTLAVDYTLPGTIEFDQLLANDAGDLQTTWQLYFYWPLVQTTVNSATVTLDWKTLLLNLKVQVSGGGVRWDEDAINTFIAFNINTSAITLSTNTQLTTALNRAISNYLKQELFVAIYSENSDAPLFWSPKLRVKNLDQTNTQQIVFRYFDSELSLTSKMDLSCLTKPDEQNNIYRCQAANNFPRTKSAANRQ